MHRLPISAVIITKNEERNIAKCLAALREVVSEIIVADSNSTDATVQIAQKMGAKVHQVEWKGYAQTKNFANQLAENDWILSIDADEVLSSELQKEIKDLAVQAQTIYKINRLNYFCGKWIKHSGWHPDWKPRLFNRRYTQWVGDFVHEKLDCSQNVKYQNLQGLLLHYSYYTIEEYSIRSEKYSTLLAKNILHHNQKPSFLKRKLAPSFRWFKMFILQRGFLDGKEGWLISRGAAQLVAKKYAKYEALKKRL